MRATPYAILYIVPALFAASLAVYGWRRRQRSGAVPFSLLMVALAFWCFCHALSVASTTLENTLFWSEAQYAGIVTTAPLWLLFALAYANREHWAPLPARVGMFGLAALSYAAVLTNSAHGLWWSSVAFAQDKGFGALEVVRGPLFWGHAAISYLYLLTGIALFVHRALGTSRFYQRQALLIIGGACIPLLGNLASLSGLELQFVDDPTPLLLLVSCVLLFHASNRYQLLDLAPIAQREVFESMPDGVIVLDQRGMITSINASARQFLPEEDDAIGQNIAEIMHISPLAIDINHMLGNSNVPQSRRITYRQHGGLHGVEIRLQPLHESRGGRAGALLVLRDMSEQVRAEHARDQRLREVSLLQQIARAANSLVQTNDVLRIISAEMLRALPWHRVVVGLLQPDNATLRLVADQLSKGEPTLEGRMVDAYTFGPVIDMLHARQPRVLDASDPSIADTPMQTVLRRLNIQTVLMLPLVSREQPLGMLFVGSTGARTIDPDEMRLFETIAKLTSDTIARTQLYEAAQEANNLKSAFLATVSHELRTPLTSVIGFADMLQSGLFGPMSEPAEEAIGHIQRSSHALLRQINDILDFSKMEASHFNVDLYPVDMSLVVQMVAGAMQPQLYARGLKLRLELEPGLPLVQANSTRLEQVLTNLIANAIKFTEQGEVVISTRERGTKVLLSVSDTGIGIPPEHQHTIFDAFRQVENPLTRRYGGTGLGLAITKRLVELMGGTISLESEPGCGSTFYCELHTAVHEGLLERAAASLEEQVHGTNHSAPQ